MTTLHFRPTHATLAGRTLLAASLLAAACTEVQTESLAPTPPPLEELPPDATPPVTALDEKPGTLVRLGAATFAFSASEEGTFRCTLDGASEVECSSPYTTPDLPDGEHTFAVYAVDAAGNRDPNTLTHTWTIDRQAPGILFEIAPDPLTNDDVPVFKVSASKPSTFTCKLDNAASAIAAVPVAASSGTAGTCAFPGVADGPHTLAVVATDGIGNVETKAYAWTVDTVLAASTLTQTSQPAIAVGFDGQAYLRATTITYAAALGEAGMLTFTFSGANSESVMAQPSVPVNRTYAVQHGLAYQLTVNYVDQASNSTQKTSTFKVDTVAPSMNAMGAINSPDKTWAESSFSGNEAAAYVCKVFRVDTQTELPATCLSIAADKKSGKARAEKAQHPTCVPLKLRVYATDAAGNAAGVSESAEFQLAQIPNTSCAVPPGGGGGGGSS